MSQRILYVRLPEAGREVEWLSLAADGALRSGAAPLEEIATEAQGARLVVLVPATLVTQAQVVLPPIKRSQLRQSALYALEEQLIDDLDELHIALGERNDKGQLPVAVVRNARLGEWLEGLAQHHLRPERLLVDSQLLPWREGEWTLLWEEGGARLRTGRDSGYGFAHEVWPELWSRLLAEAGEVQPQRVRLLDGRRVQEPPLFPEVLLPGVEVELVGNMAGLQWLNLERGGKLQLPEAINLLQGHFSRREQWGQLLRPWRPAAVLLLLWLVLQTSLSIFDLHTQRQEVAQLDQQMESLYRSTFPEARKVVDASLQMEQRLTALKSGDGGFIRLVAKAAPALQGAHARLKGMRYQQGSLDVDVALADMAALDALRGALADTGLQVEIGNTASQDGRVESRLTLRGGGSQ